MPPGIGGIAGFSFGISETAVLIRIKKNFYYKTILG